jgi:site-specific DNA-cytosine methylase
LQASDYKWVQQQQVEQGKLIVTNRDKDKRYIVRRLMPIETTRLQGYPDFWHHLAPFDGDVEFWESVRKTWARINGTTYKPFKDIARLEKWYYKLRNDGAEYKADGNSLAIPCAEYVIRRIAETVLEESNQNIDKQQ